MLSFEEISGLVEKSVLSLRLKGEPAELYDPIEYLISIGGKRIRPKLCLTVYNLFSDRFDRSVLDPAMALEIFHAFTLIHDDIMDKADLRRGQPTVHRKWNENIALLSGDVMSIKAGEYLLSAPSDLLKPVLTLFNRTAAQVCEGQQYDMNYESIPVITQEDYTRMIALKTAVLIACSAQMGAILGRADERTADALYRYGYDLGLAFQITDDYLDSFGNTSTFGKNLGGDIVNNKKSWLLVETLRRAEGADRTEVLETMKMGPDRAAEKIARMQALYEKLGVCESSRKAIESYYHSAMEAVRGIGLGPEQTDRLDEYAALLIRRDK